MLGGVVVQQLFLSWLPTISYLKFLRLDFRLLITWWSNCYLLECGDLKHVASFAAVKIFVAKHFIVLWNLSISLLSQPLIFCWRNEIHIYFILAYDQQKNREMFEPFIEDDVPFDEYCQSMEKDGTWAGHMELQAASLVTHSNICIHRVRIYHYSYL